MSRLPKETLDRLRLKAIELPIGHPLDQTEQSTTHVVFIESGMCSMTAIFDDGSEVEIAVFGHETAIGLSALMGDRKSTNRTFMQMSGGGYIAKFADVEAEFRKGELFHKLALATLQTQLAEARQSVACNAIHTVQQRIARWLLMSADRLGSTQFVLSQEFLAIMLGVRRTSVALAMGRLKREGVVQYMRTRVVLLDIPKLEAETCECYRILKKQEKDSASS